MMRHMAEGASHIYLACGPTDFQKQIQGLTALVSLHWILDIHFREDASTANTDHALANLALLRKIAFNFTKLDSAMTKKNDRFHDRS